MGKTGKKRKIPWLISMSFIPTYTLYKYTVSIKYINTYIRTNTLNTVELHFNTIGKTHILKSTNLF